MSHPVCYDSSVETPITTANRNEVQSAKEEMIQTETVISTIPTESYAQIDAKLNCDTVKEVLTPAPKKHLRKRRRQIDPTTCERSYSADEVEFMNALNRYKQTSGRLFPTCSEILEVLRSLGYVKLSPIMNEEEVQKEEAQRRAIGDTEEIVAGTLSYMATDAVSEEFAVHLNAYSIRTE